MKTHRWDDLKKARKLSPVRRAAIDRAVREELAVISLREIREVAGKTQAQVASVMAKAQAEISQIEKRDDLELSTLRKYIKRIWASTPHQGYSPLRFGPDRST